MVELTSKAPCGDLLPIQKNGLALSEIDPGPITALAPYQGKDKAVSAALKKAVGVGLPQVGKSLSNGDVRVLWAGRDQFFLLAAAAPKLPAAVVDQSDAWAMVFLEGPQADDVVARLCPVDVNSMKIGDVVRSLIGHMGAVIVKVEDGYEMMVFRAFAHTLVHEVTHVMEAVTARSEITD